MKVKSRDRNLVVPALLAFLFCSVGQAKSQDCDKVNDSWAKRCVDANQVNQCPNPATARSVCAIEINNDAHGGIILTRLDTNAVLTGDMIVCLFPNERIVWIERFSNSTSTLKF